MTVKRIHVNRNIIDSNRKHGTNNPPVTVKLYKSWKHKTPFGNEYGHSIHIDGPSTVVYDPEHPLDCGAKLWIQTDADVEVIREGF